MTPECGQQSEGKLFKEGIICFMASHNLSEFVPIHTAGKENIQNYYAYTLKDWLPRLEKTYKTCLLTCLLYDTNQKFIALHRKLCVPKEIYPCANGIFYRESKTQDLPSSCLKK